MVTNSVRPSVPPKALGDAAGFLLEGNSAILQMYKDEIVGVDLPAAVEMEITYTEPGLQGDRSSAGRKPWAQARTELGGLWRKVRRQIAKDYVRWQLLSGLSAPTTPE